MSSPSAIRVGLLRGTRFNPLNIVRNGRTYLYQQPESGKYVFRYSITSSHGDWRAARPWQAGMAASSPLLPVGTSNELSTKTLPATRSFCSLDREDVVVSAVKKADRGDFESCPLCGKGFEDLTPDAQRAVKATLAPFFEVPQIRQTA